MTFYSVREHETLSLPLYTKREEVVSQIPNFWPLVFEQAPAEIDEYISPQDSAVLLNSLKTMWVDRFELDRGEPRSVSVRLEFTENEYFENTVLEKKFWWRYAKDGWAGLVSEPVPIKWKGDKDLTNGMLDLVQKVYEEEKAAGTAATAGEDSEAKKALKKQMEDTGLGGISFFAWFGFRGRKISAEESAEASKKLQEKRKARKAADAMDEDESQADDEDDEDDEEDDDEYDTEVFPTGDDVAICITDDLWPNAIKYFRECIEDSIFETVEDAMEEAAARDHSDDAMEE